MGWSSTQNIQMEDKSTGCDMDITPPYNTSPRDNHVTSNGNHGNGVVLTSPARGLNNHLIPDKADLAKNLSLFCDKLSDEENNRSEDNESTATTPSTISNCTR